MTGFVQDVLCFPRLVNPRREHVDSSFVDVGVYEVARGTPSAVGSPDAAGGH